MTLPQVNCRLLRVEAGGTTVDWDTSDSNGPQKFKGKVGGYYTEKRVKERTAEGENIVLRRSLIFEPDLPDIQWEDEDVVTFEYRGSTRTGKVQLAEERDLPGAPVIGSIRLTLQDV